jgi:hypothetical protein
VRRLLAPALAVLAALPIRAAAEDGLRFDAAVRLLTTSHVDYPTTLVLFDRGSSTFLIDDYLTTSQDEQYGSALLALSVDGRHFDGALRWRLALDTGELRSQRFNALTPACPSNLTGSGLAYVGSGRCNMMMASPWLVEDTRLQPPELTANGRPVAEELKDTAMIREAWVAWSFGRAGFATLRAGRFRQSVADGLVHDDYVSGVDADFDLGALGPPFEARAALFQPTRDFPSTVAGIRPLLLLRFDWIPSLFEHAGLFLAARHDKTGGIAELVRGAYVEDAVVQLSGLAEGTAAYQAASRQLAAVLSSSLVSTSTTAWVGTTGSLVTFDRQRFSWTAALLRGHVDQLGLASNPATTDIPLKGSAAWLRWEWSPADWVSVTPWFLYLSGDRPPPEKARLGLPQGYDAFLGINPWVTATNLFFRGGLSETFAARQVTAAGVNGRGVIAPGLTAVFDVGPYVDVTTRAAWLTAEDAGPWGGKVYGTEVDLMATWQPTPWVQLGAEFDVLFPGDFFGGSGNVYKSILALDVHTP